MDEARKLDEVAGRMNDALVILARVETRLEGMTEKHAETGRVLADHETRLRTLERARWVLVGAAGVAGGLAGKLAGLLG